MAATNLFERPELLDNQTRLILSADAKPRWLNRSGAHSAGQHILRERSDSVGSESIIQQQGDDLLDENDGINKENSPRQKISVAPEEVNYDTDIEQEPEAPRDYTCKKVYAEQCRRHGVIPSTYFLRQMDSDTIAIRYSALKPINIKVMVPSLKVNSTITKLDLQDNGIGSRGAVYISYLIKENEFIDELNLANNDIGIQGMNT